jgi:ribosomal protein L11 methyltransferase
VPWLSITLEMDPAAADAFSEALIEAGADSVSLETAGDRMRLELLAPAQADADALVNAAAHALGMEAPAFRTGRVEDEDWVRRSQSQFGPIRVSDALWIVPSWHEPPAQATTVVRLDPGLAFGTGSHVSTRLILQRLEPLLRGAASPPRVLDYGCGSGILAIVAARLGAGKVAAVDIDPQALEATAANAADNGVRLAVCAPESLPEEEYDVVLANILAGPLIALEPLLAARTRPGGRILLSGILESQATDVVQAYAADFEAAVTAADEGWALVEGRRR